MHKACAALFLALLLPACAITKMEAKLDPMVDVAESNVGQGRTVALSVIDERPSRDIGKRAAVGASIEMKADIAAIFQEKIGEGLRRHGFSVVNGASPDAATLRIDVRSLDYDVSTGWWTGGIDVSAAMKARAQGALEEYERLYRANKEDRVVFVPGAKGSNERINAVVADLLRQLFEDQKMLEVLAARHNPEA